MAQAVAQTAEQPVTGFKIYCMKCRAHTATMKEITLKRNIGNQYYVIGKCVHCAKGKSKQLNQEEKMRTFQELLNMPLKSSITSFFLWNGRSLPLATLIPVLIGENVMGDGLAPSIQEESPLSIKELLKDAGYSKNDLFNYFMNYLEENGFEITYRGSK